MPFTITRGGETKTFYLRSQSESDETYDFEADASQAQRTYDVSLTGATGAEVPRLLLGWPERAVSAGGTPYIKRNIPHSIFAFRQQPDEIDPIFYAVKCKFSYLSPRATISDVVLEDQIGQYEAGRCVVQYKTLPFDIHDDQWMLSNGYKTGTSNDAPDESRWKRYVMKQAKPSGEFFTLRTGSYTYVGGGGEVQQGISKLIVPYNLQVTWYQVPENCVPCMALNPSLQSTGTGPGTPGAIDTAIGKVNKLAFNGYKPGTLLLMGVDFRPYRSPFGNRIFDLTFMFKYFEPKPSKSHQYIFKADTAGTPPEWTEATTTGATNDTDTTRTNGEAPRENIRSIYDWAEFAPCFRPV